jgi:tyrosinase
MHWIAVAVLSLILPTADSLITRLPTASLKERQSSQNDLVTGIEWRDENGEPARSEGSEISGLTTEVGDVPLRREVRDLKDNYPDQWNLYILALEAMQMTDPQDESSYYAVAGKFIKTL